MSDETQYVQSWEGVTEDEDALKRYALQIQLDKVTDPYVAAKILDMYTDMGHDGVRLVQRAAGAFEDGGIGPETLRAVNSCDPNNLLWCLSNLSLTYYTLRDGDEETHARWDKRARALGTKGVNMTLGLGGPQNEQVLVPKRHGRRSGSGTETER